MSDEDLKLLIAEAYREGYLRARRDMMDDDQLVGLRAIMEYVYGGRMVSEHTFRDHRNAGRFGMAIIGRGHNVRARKSELDAAMKAYEMSKL